MSKVYVIVQVLPSGVYRFVNVLKTREQASTLSRELRENNASVGITEVSYKIIEKNI